MNGEDNQNNNGFLKETGKKFAETVEKAEKAKNKVKLFMALPTPVKIAIIAIPIVIIVILIFTAATDYILDWFRNNFIVDAFANSFYSSDGTNNTDITRILSIENNNWTLNICDELRELLRGALTQDEGTFVELLRDNGIETNIDEMSQRDMILAILILNGLEPEELTEEELNLIPTLLKAELSTRAIDLRPSNEMYINGEYQIQNYDENSDIIPGTIHFKRINSGVNNGQQEETILQYIDYETFKELIGTDKNVEQYNDAKKYFSINQDGKVVIATWFYLSSNHDYINGTGEVPEEGRLENTVAYTLREEIINYEGYINKYILPYEVLVGLLVSSEDCNFVKEVANLAFGSNIEISIFEEYNWSETTYNTQYYETIRNYQYAELFARINGRIFSSIPEKLIIRETSDEPVIWEGQPEYDGKSYTYKEEIFTENQPSYTCEETIIREQNTYTYGITKADTWWINLTKEYTIEEETSDEQINSSTTEDTYKFYQNTDDARTEYFEEYLEENADNLRSIARSNSSSSTESGSPTVEVVRSGVRITWDRGIKKIIYIDADNNSEEENCNNATEYIISASPSPQNITVVDSSENTYQFDFNASGRYSQREQEVEIELGYNGRTEQYKKVDTNTTIIVNEKTYKIQEGTTTQRIYDQKDEKFLLAFDNNPKARGNILSTPGWLEEYLDDYNPDFTTIIDYLLYAYVNGPNDELSDDLLNIFRADDFTNLNTSNNSEFWWPIGSTNTTTENGVTFASEEPADSYISSNFGSRIDPISGEQRTHNGIDIARMSRENINIIAVADGTVKDVSKVGSMGGTACYVIIEHENGIVTKYWHLKSQSITVNVGDRVLQGQVIGIMGDTGYATGVHLHFEIIDAQGNAIDPNNKVSLSTPRPEISSGTLRDWLWTIEGGEDYIDSDGMWIVFDPEGAGDNTMNLAHGMVIASENGGESWYQDVIPGRIYAGQKVTEDIAMQIWNIKIEEFINAIDAKCSTYDITLTSYQRDAAVSYIYRVGKGRAENFISAYAEGGEAGLWNYMKNGYHRSYQTGTKSRIAEEFELFTTGDYNYNPSLEKYNLYCARY